MVKVVETSDQGVLKSIQNEAKILPKLNCSLINKFGAYFEDPERNKAYLVIEDAGDKTLTEFLEEARDSTSVNQARLSTD